MYQAIVTKYLGADHRGSRIKATAAAKSITVGYYSGSNSSYDAPHIEAAKKLATELGWAGVYIGGGMPNGTGCCFVHLDMSADGALPALKNDPAFIVTAEDAAPAEAKRHAAYLKARDAEQM